VHLEAAVHGEASRERVPHTTEGLCHANEDPSFVDLDELDHEFAVGIEKHGGPVAVGDKRLSGRVGPDPIGPTDDAFADDLERRAALRHGDARREHVHDRGPRVRLSREG
jgi:hypothetical protein